MHNAFTCMYNFTYETPVWVNSTIRENIISGNLYRLSPIDKMLILARYMLDHKAKQTKPYYSLMGGRGLHKETHIENDNHSDNLWITALTQHPLTGISYWWAADNALENRYIIPVWRRGNLFQRWWLLSPRLDRLHAESVKRLWRRRLARRRALAIGHDASLTKHDEPIQFLFYRLSKVSKS